MIAKGRGSKPDWVEFERKASKFIADAKAGLFDGGEYPDLPEGEPLRTGNDDSTLVVFLRTPPKDR